MRAICTYVGCTKVTTDYWDIRLLVTISFIGYYLRNNWMNITEWIPTIKLTLESTHQTVSNDILYIIWRSVFIEIQNISI